MQFAVPTTIGMMAGLNLSTSTHHVVGTDVHMYLYRPRKVMWFRLEIY
jgi:hypothetical protein